VYTQQPGAARQTVECTLPVRRTVLQSLQHLDTCVCVLRGCIYCQQ
jgi:hypothetical protein